MTQNTKEMHGDVHLFRILGVIHSPCDILRFRRLFHEVECVGGNHQFLVGRDDADCNL